MHMTCFASSYIRLSDCRRQSRSRNSPESIDTTSMGEVVGISNNFVDRGLFGTFAIDRGTLESAGQDVSEQHFIYTHNTGSGAIGDADASRDALPIFHRGRGVTRLRNRAIFALVAFVGPVTKYHSLVERSGLRQIVGTGFCRCMSYRGRGIENLGGNVDVRSAHFSPQ